jgi:prepilin-type N-terminal cleavage/methylation domain-containing protein/prepilin-type processing-associated H-X9-DG protein
MKRNSRVRKGFTLIELLVVIAIIAVLAALLMPALRDAVERGRAMACISNLRQIGVSMYLGVNDRNGFLPNAYSTCAGPGPGAFSQPCKFGLTDYHWARVLTEYAGTGSPCPAFTTEFSDHSKITYSFSDWGRAHSSYPYHVYPEDFRTPGKAVMVVDRNDNAADDLYFRPRPIEWSGQPLYDPAYRHLEGANVLHADGSAGWLEGLMIVDTKNWTEEWHCIFLGNNPDLAGVARADVM